MYNTFIKINTINFFFLLIRFIDIIYSGLFGLRFFGRTQSYINYTRDKYTLKFSRNMFGSNVSQIKCYRMLINICLYSKILRITVTLHQKLYIIIICRLKQTVFRYFSKILINTNIIPKIVIKLVTWLFLYDFHRLWW